MGVAVGAAVAAGVGSTVGERVGSVSGVEVATTETTLRSAPSGEGDAEGTDLDELGFIKFPTIPMTRIAPITKGHIRRFLEGSCSDGWTVGCFFMFYPFLFELRLMYQNQDSTFNNSNRYLTPGNNVVLTYISSFKKLSPTFVSVVNRVPLSITISDSLYSFQPT